jgi:hypothetical protein
VLLALGAWGCSQPCHSQENMARKKWRLVPIDLSREITKEKECMKDSKNVERKISQWQLLYTRRTATQSYSKYSPRDRFYSQNLFWHFNCDQNRDLIQTPTIIVYRSAPMKNRRKENSVDLQITELPSPGSPQRWDPLIYRKPKW